MYNDIDRPANSNLVALTYLIYGLHLFSAVTGIITSAAVVTAFLTGWPSIIAVILNYIKRGDVRGTYLESHFSWQIRTFWFSLLWVVIAGVLFITVIGIPIAWVMVFLIGAWLLYRMVRGLLRLMDNRPINFN
ncbi:MAG: hypothetical protein HKN19_07205 [Halioglobus sp.]|nr:hypothetical protein [Halioglobus sp.]